MCGLAIGMGVNGRRAGAAWRGVPAEGGTGDERVLMNGGARMRRVLGGASFPQDFSRVCSGQARQGPGQRPWFPGILGSGAVVPGARLCGARPPAGTAHASRSYKSTKDGSRPCQSMWETLKTGTESML